MYINENKISLIRELCGKLPDNIIIHVKKDDIEFDGQLKSIKGEYMLVSYNGMELTVNINEIKPYFRKLTSMTNNELEEFYNLVKEITNDKTKIYKLFDFFNSHYFDTRNFIENNLALEATTNLYFIK